MDDKQAEFLSLLKANHTFPGPYTCKFIGRDDNDFVARVIAAIRNAMLTDADPPFTTRSSKNGEHVAVTVMLLVSSPDQVIAVYGEVKKVQGLEMSL